MEWIWYLLSWNVIGFDWWNRQKKLRKRQKLRDLSNRCFLRFHTEILRHHRFFKQLQGWCAGFLSWYIYTDSSPVIFPKLELRARIFSEEVVLRRLEHEIVVFNDEALLIWDLEANTRERKRGRMEQCRREEEEIGLEMGVAKEWDERTSLGTAAGMKILFRPAYYLLINENEN